MLTELYEKVHAWLAAAGVTAYAEDAVPEGAGFPFATFRIDAPSVESGSGLLTLTCWHRGDAAHGERLAMADRLAALVPTGGALLRLTGGLALLTRAEESAAPCREEDALGIRIPFRLRVYGVGRA